MSHRSMVIFAAALLGVGVVGLIEHGEESSPEVSSQRLVQQGATEPADKDTVPLLQQAMLRQDRSAFEKLLKEGANPAEGTKDGRTAMHLAAMGREGFWLDTLLEHGISPDLPDTVTGAPPLFAALKARMPKNVDRLLAAGADLDAQDRNGTRPLHEAALVNDPRAALKFLEAGADPLAKDKTGAAFQAYFAMADRRLLNRSTRRSLERIDAWLTKHGVPLNGDSR